MSHIQLHIAGMPMHFVCACGRSGHGFGPRTQSFFIASQVHVPSQMLMLSRSQTESPGMHGSDCTQPSVGSQYDIGGHAASFGL
jgi:hypothetical protein